MRVIAVRKLVAHACLGPRCGSLVKSHGTAGCWLFCTIWQRRRLIGRSNLEFPSKTHPFVWFQLNAMHVKFKNWRVSPVREYNFIQINKQIIIRITKYSYAATQTPNFPFTKIVPFIDCLFSFMSRLVRLTYFTLPLFWSIYFDINTYTFMSPSNYITIRQVKRKVKSDPLKCGHSFSAHKSLIHIFGSPIKQSPRRRRGVRLWWRRPTILFPLWVTTSCLMETSHPKWEPYLYYHSLDR